MRVNPNLLHDIDADHSSCGVGFITRKDSVQTHDLIRRGHEALCAVPHRGGMSSSGIGDGAGIFVDLSHEFFSQLVGLTLMPGQYGVGNFFLPKSDGLRADSEDIIHQAFDRAALKVLLKRKLPVNDAKIEPRGVELQLPIYQWIFKCPEGMTAHEVDGKVFEVLLEIESAAFRNERLSEFYPLSLSTHSQVLKGRLNSWELIPYFDDLNSQEHKVHTLFFHTRFSTNTDPHPSMAQPFRVMAHNGELNTDKKNRLFEVAEAKARNFSVVRPKGQSDSCRFDRTLSARIHHGDLDLIASVVSMMPPAWENDAQLSPEVRAMFEYFSLYEEKNDGPAALIFSDGRIVGARLDRLGLRPLRSVETDKYLAVTSEAGQINFAPEEIIGLGRIEAGGMVYFDHHEGRVYETEEALEKLANAKNYASLLEGARVHINEVEAASHKELTEASLYSGDLNLNARYVSYFHNQESFKFLLDPMLSSGMEKVSAMGYGSAINALNDNEGGVAKYFSQRFAQVTNPPLDSVREADGMTLRVALGEKPLLGPSESKQIVVDSPILSLETINVIRNQTNTPCITVDTVYAVDTKSLSRNEALLVAAIEQVANKVTEFARDEGGIVILSDRNISAKYAALPTTLLVSAVNQSLIAKGLRLRVSLIVESGQVKSSHHIACALGFGASAVYALAVQIRAEEKYPENPREAYSRFVKAAEKALKKTMGKVGLCTVESYSGGEFFEPNFLDADDPIFSRFFPNIKSPVGGVQFDRIAQSTSDWHERALTVVQSDGIPILGLFKERAVGAGHSFGTTAVRGFVDLTEEDIEFSVAENDRNSEPMRLMTLGNMEDALGITDQGYVNTSFDQLKPKQINEFSITQGYRRFSADMANERLNRPAALRDVLSFPADITGKKTAEEIKEEMMLFNRAGNLNFYIRGLSVTSVKKQCYAFKMNPSSHDDGVRLKALQNSLEERFGKDIEKSRVNKDELFVQLKGQGLDYVSRILCPPAPIPLSMVQPASEITPRFASGAMSHGALVASAHEAVAHGTNMVGGMSNCGEGGEHFSRFGTIRASRIKQFASGRFGVWAAYLADPNLKEIEIKIGQGAKPGEGGQLPGPKVTVEIAAARGGTPGVELVSPPPHHDTYSIEDLGQLIHDAKAARTRVIVKLVSSEGIGTIAVGVAKAGADVINIAGNTGGTGAASVTSLKYTGRAAELGIAEVHQALCLHGLRQKVTLRCSGAMQTGSDVLKACLLGGDSFEFGTTALMMLKCVMAKNCNIKCPAGLTTNAEAFDGDPRALAQYLLNIAHEVRELLANLGFSSLDDARGRADLLHLLDHPASVGQINLRKMLVNIDEVIVPNPTYLERDYRLDQDVFELISSGDREQNLDVKLAKPIELSNQNKSFGGQLAIDIERLLNYETHRFTQNDFLRDDRGRFYLRPGVINIQTRNSAGQSYGVFCNDGMRLHHWGTCNDGVGKGACGGEIIIQAAPSSAHQDSEKNVLVGNFALFGATGGRLFVRGQAGDRFAVRNSGASAVVEGVGDFCCEYMTNGVVLNLGRFSKGFGNGMSGGFAYQYDPDGRFHEAVSHDSVLTGQVDQSDEMGSIHHTSIKLLLEWHAKATSSTLASRLLDEWHDEAKNFVWVMPKALLQYQDSSAILESKSRKELVEELSTALARHQISRLKSSWKSQDPVLDGFSPSDENTDSEKMYRLLNSWTVLDFARELAEQKTSNETKADIEKKTKNLVLTEDYDLMNGLSKHAKAALTDYDDNQIASLVADKRLNDFKMSLLLRSVRSMDSPTTYGWIMFQNRKNRETLGIIPSFEELFAKSAVPERIQNIQIG
ncbi:MAG: glutamate synthase large subunit [Gammaproteobacteria bacterium]|nr:glutamate synthase large subunit [Gammaproteobacteria bacterium]